MISQKTLRPYLLIAGLGIAVGSLLRPAQLGPPESNLETDWSLPEPPQKPFGPTVATDISSLSWWGEKHESLAMQGSHEASTVVKRKVAWCFKGVVLMANKRYALVAEDANAQPKRYLPGESLPGGERLEMIDAQGIRFSLPDEGGDQERKLYVPAE